MTQALPPSKGMCQVMEAAVLPGNLLRLVFLTSSALMALQSTELYQSISPNLM